MISCRHAGYLQLRLVFLKEQMLLVDISRTVPTLTCKKLFTVLSPRLVRVIVLEIQPDIGKHFSTSVGVAGVLSVESVIISDITSKSAS